MPKITGEDRFAIIEQDLDRYISHAVSHLEDLISDLTEVREMTLAYAYINAREYLDRTNSGIERVRSALTKAAEYDEKLRTKRSSY